MPTKQQHEKPQALPLSITVRNLFPPLAISNAAAAAAAASVDDSDANASADSVCHDDKEVGCDDNDDDDDDDDVDENHTSNRNRLMMAATTFTSIEGRCARASRDILLRLRLDVILKNQPPPTPTPKKDGSDDEITTSVVILSMTQSHSTSHPRWDHINERLLLTTLLSSSAASSTTDCYARFVILNDGANDDTKTESHGQGGGEVVLAEISLNPSKLRCLPSSVAPNTNMDDNNIDDNSINGGSIRRSNDNNNNNNSNGVQMIIPHTLPPNTILLHYDDGYTRVLPSVYSFLLQREIICENYDNGMRDGTTTRNEKEVHARKGPFFEDKAFDLLSDNSPSDAAVMSMGTTIASTSVIASAAELLPPPSDNNDASSSVIFDDSIFDLMGSRNDDGVCRSSRNAGQIVPVTTRPDVATNADAAAATKPHIYDIKSNVTLRQLDADDNEEDTEEAAAEENAKLLVSSSAVLADRGTTIGPTHPSEEELPLLPPNTSKIENKSFISDDDADNEEEEIEELRRLVHLERQLLEEDWHRITKESNDIKSIMQQIQLLDNETFDITRNVNIERTTLLYSELQLEANRIHLLQQLRLLFPIKLVPITNVVHPPNHPQHEYTISNIPLPEDIHSPTVSDDQISFALGLVCHLVSLTSKYLAVPLRYTLICKFSRSAVLFDWSYPQGGGGGNATNSTSSSNNKETTTTVNNNNTPAMITRAVYPLFRERNVIDREQLDYGRTLLERNVNCLLQVRGVPFRKEWNILAKMDKLLLHVVEGE